MNHRISAGGIVVKDGLVLLVHHQQPGAFDFWVLPGGGVEGHEGIFKAAEREILEETSLTVTAHKIAYVEDFIDEDRYVCKFWVYCTLEHGTLSTARRQPGEEFLKEARFVSKAEIQGLNVFPPLLKDRFWKDLAAGFPAIHYLGYQAW